MREMRKIFSANLSELTIISANDRILIEVLHKMRIF